MKRIVMAVTNDLVTDQRVDRSCKALHEAGYEILLIGRLLPNSMPLSERPYQVHRMKLAFRRSALFYAEYNLRLLAKLLFTRADAYYANDTDTLLACTWAARLRRKKLIFDAHELFPEVPELVLKPQVRRVWEWVERSCLPRVDAALTVCQSVADEYRNRYGVAMGVVRNLPSWNKAKTSANPHPNGEKWTLLYQGAVNVGRGIRELIDVMELLPNCRLQIAGDGDISGEMRAYALSKPWHERIAFLGRVAPDDLHPLTAASDLGLCLLEDLGLNYRYSLPNRIADFAYAGVPILATDFVEIRRVVAGYGIGTLVPACPAKKEGAEYRDYIVQLAQAVNTTLDQYWQQLPRQERERLFEAAAHDLDWQKEKNVLLASIDAIK